MPFNAQATLFRRAAFWSLYLPISVHGRVSDIWRSYIFQALTKCTRQLVAMHSPVVEHVRNSHSNLADFNAEIPLYEKAGRLVDFVQQYICPHDTLPLCLLDVYMELFRRGYVEEEDVFGVQAWLLELMHIGTVEFPRIHCTSQQEVSLIANITCI